MAGENKMTNTVTKDTKDAKKNPISEDRLIIPNIRKSSGMSNKVNTEKGGNQENKANVCFILNFYGSHDEHGRRVAFGGLIRTKDKDGGWFLYGENRTDDDTIGDTRGKQTSNQTGILGPMSRRIDTQLGKQISKEEVAKLMGLREGLKIAREKGISELEVEVDSENVLDLVQDKDKKYHAPGNIIADCNDRINDKQWNCKIKRIKKGKDVHVNMLANKGHPCISLDVQDAKKP